MNPTMLAPGNQCVQIVTPWDGGTVRRIRRGELVDSGIDDVVYESSLSALLESCSKSSCTFPWTSMIASALASSLSTVRSRHAAGQLRSSMAHPDHPQTIGPRSPRGSLRDLDAASRCRATSTGPHAAATRLSHRVRCNGRTRPAPTACSRSGRTDVRIVREVSVPAAICATFHSY